MHDVSLVRVFPQTPDGGNPAPVVLDADGMTAAEMKDVARHYGHESAFVSRAEASTRDFRFRFFVPNHEMEMCGHATLGALWLLRKAGRWTSEHASIETLSGRVDARYDAATDRIAVSQPAGRLETIHSDDLVSATLAALRLSPDDLLPLPIINATTSRTKTLIPLRDVARLQTLTPHLDRIEALCDALSSTGLYPFAPEPETSPEAPEAPAAPAAPAHFDTFQARQFPRSSGYPEDAATGIAAAALLYGVRHYDLLLPTAPGIAVHQGVAMGRPSTISASFRSPSAIDQGCWLSGDVHLIHHQGKA